MRSPPLATLRFLNGRGTWDPGPHKGQRGASLKNAGLKGPPQLRWVPWPPEQARCPECEQQWLGARLAQRLLLCWSQWAAREGPCTGNPEAGSQGSSNPFPLLSLHHAPGHVSFLLSLDDSQPRN